MSLLKTNEIQNYNGSSLTLTASTVSTSAQLNTGGNISVTGSLNVSDDSTTRTNLGLGTIATQDSNNVNLTGGTIGSGVVFPAGHIIQVEQATITTYSQYTLNTTFADITGLSKSITPSSSSNQILVSVHVHVGLQNGSNESYPKIRLVRDSTNIAISTETDSRQKVTSMFSTGSPDINVAGVMSMNWIDSPSSTSSVTYKVQVFGSQNRTFYVNITGANENSAGGNAVSTLTLMEIQR